MLPGIKRLKPIKECQNCKIKKSETIQLLKCSRCMTTYYCSEECQRSHYIQHKVCCIGLNAFEP